MFLRHGVTSLAFAVLFAGTWGACSALTADQTLSMAAGDADSRITALQAAVAQAGSGPNDTNPNLLASTSSTFAFIQALASEQVRVITQSQGSAAIILLDGVARNPLNGEKLVLSPEVLASAQEPLNNNRMRGEIDNALAAFKLLSSDDNTRRSAITTLQGHVGLAQLPLLERAIQAETVQDIAIGFKLLRAAAWLSSDNPAQRLEAARQLGQSAQAASQTLLSDRLSLESDPDVKQALLKSLTAVQARLAWGDRLGALFSGISLGSILLLVALGLAITYGLMGVINMAHGELMMVGAYATYLVQMGFQRFWPAGFDWYLLASVPVAFMASAAVGAVMERLVIRHLYGRPLETLLATWGMSLLLMQAVRTLFGAQNVGVENPGWMSGGVAVFDNLSLPYNRIIIIGFSLAVLAAVAWVISRTRMGLFVRAVTQNRPIAACMGVPTQRIDTLAFALGSGIAGLAGCALSQVGNVGPDLGQSYIVDAFMVVVLGGVGQLAGTVLAALGLGIVNKWLEGLAGAVLAKIAVLVMIVVFIQKRPQGIFAMRGRSAEA